MSWQPTTDWRYCPVCGSGKIEVDPSRNDYYQGDLYRCADGHGFYALPGDLSPLPPPRPRGENPNLDALEDMLRAGARRMMEELGSSGILLAELERENRRR